MPAPPESIKVENNSEAQQYELLVDGELAGLAAYRLRPGRVVFVHTEIYPRWGGMGLGKVLAKSALDDVIASGQEITPLCSFIAGYIRTHPDYIAYVDEKHQAELREPPEATRPAAETKTTPPS